MSNALEPLSPKKLRRSSRSRMIGGVCGGVAEYFGLDPTVVRVGFVLLSLISAAFPGLIVYLVLLLIMPLDERGS